MTRWQRFGWALGYTALTVVGVMMWMYAVDTDVFNCLGATSLIYGLGVGAYAENDLIACTMFILFLVIGAGLLIVPVLTAFNLKVPLYALMGLDVLGRIILIVHKVMERNSVGMSGIILGLVVSIGVLAVTVHKFCQPEKTAEVQGL
ncbi:MAG: hypothetical protein IJB81_11875 [Clostridia bacterium]|nr:hypothetical protein [Clostridia bacterium]